MKNIKDTLYEWRKLWYVTIATCIIADAPIAIWILPVGNCGTWEISKWGYYTAICALLVCSTIAADRLLHHERTIEKMNEEIEELKEEIGKLKNKNYE